MSPKQCLYMIFFIHLDSIVLPSVSMGEVPNACRQANEVSWKVIEEETLANSSKRKFSGTHKSQAWRWLNAKPLSHKSLRVVHSSTFEKAHEELELLQWKCTAGIMSTGDCRPHLPFMQAGIWDNASVYNP